jgi:hypothetical protein
MTGDDLVCGWRVTSDLPLPELPPWTDQPDTPADIAIHLGAFLNLPTDPAIVADAVAACRFEALRAAEAAEGFPERPADAERFFRRGQADGWRRDLTPGQAACIAAAHGAVMERLGYGVSEPPFGA